ncbi:MAG TPA: hypothetical protein VMU08_08575 [Rhizomicrobium sp.]|nr:hypothetical protein [Rhizomicrobium sp.]
MTLADIASLSSAISGVAVVASLAFLYFQVRQVGEQVKLAEKNQQAAIRQGRTNRIVEMMLAQMEPSITEALMKAARGDEDLTPVQLAQYQASFVASINHFEDSFYQHEEGLLNDVAFATVVGGIRAAVRSPGYRAGWASVGMLREGAFPEFMNRMIAETPLAPPGDALEDWKQALAKVRAAAKG